MRFHVVGLPHTQTTSAYSCCAFTQNVIKFCKMMKRRGHEIILYSGEHNEAECDEHITIVTDSQQEYWFGKTNHSNFYSVDFNQWHDYWTETNKCAVDHIKIRAKVGDFVCIIGGISQQSIAYHLPNLTSVEYAVGYEGTFARYRCFASQALRNHCHGIDRERVGRRYDTVIPHYFETEGVPFCESKEDYYLYTGRLIQNKGVEIAVEACRRTGVKLLIAGQGAKEVTRGKIVTDQFTVEGNIEYLGVLKPAERDVVMSKARALFVPSQYLEPFGMVVIEANLCGTPVITSNFGAFPEIVYDGITGIRCDTIPEYAKAVVEIGRLRPRMIRAHAMNYSLENIAPQYERWFKKLLMRDED